MVRKAGSNILATDHKLKNTALAKKNKGLLHMKQLNKVCLKEFNYHIVIFNLADRLRGWGLSLKLNKLFLF